ncbi:type VI secretion system-associated protein TagF [Caldovatus aquaticus]|uniref:Type VI secretion system-associated protein TagF n=1 Tax=Caldovatus aquaticus TaxID=2865671 RepID=A0ABS7F5J4_9PROT|nr:type VI secretion system-associated protein TagF [Caldovatus aquaticus]MBW8270232.1 type VI secretion system-associated protein TagF [Caldovatus aquaticus]
MPDAAALTALGLYGKLPAHGDFVRRALPRSFVAPWDAWLQAGIAAARAALGAAWEEAWRDGPVWRFALPAGACGPEAVAGVLAPSADAVGRRFPLTLAAVFAAAEAAARAEEAWFDALERLAEAGRAGDADADALAAALPSPAGAGEQPVRDAVMALLDGADDAAGGEGAAPALPGRPAAGLWTRGGARLPAMVWETATLPAPEEFAMLLEGPS